MLTSGGVFARHPQAQVGRSGGDSGGGGGGGGDDAGGGVGGCDGGDDGGGDDGGGDDGDAGGDGGGGGEGDDGGGGGGDENRVFIEVPSPVTRCKAPRFRSRHDADLAHAGTDLTTEYAVRDGLAAAVAASFRTGLGTVPDRSCVTAAATSSSSTPTAGAASSFRAGLGTVPVRSPATAAATSSSRTPTAGAASSVPTLDRTAAVAAVSISQYAASAAASFRAGIGAVPVRFPGGDCGSLADFVRRDDIRRRVLLEGTRSACGG